MTLVIAYRQLRSFVNTERLKVAMKLLDDFSNRDAGHHSVADELRHLANRDPMAVGKLVEAGEPSHEEHELGYVTQCFIDLHNYFDNLDDLYRPNAVDRGYILSRFGSIIVEVVATTGPYYSLIQPSNLTATVIEHLRNEVVLCKERHASLKTIRSLLVEYLYDFLLDSPLKAQEILAQLSAAALVEA
ncbi:MAG: hypothetical protein WB615_08375 [Candidatus Tumulicola sp.]